jgi:UDP-N-acetylglucosamine transferase subunit ALG13
MIFVTVGTHDQPFDRLVRAADELAARIDEPVVMQQGCSRLQSNRAQSFDWATIGEMEEWIERARVVIAQAGAGTMITAFRHRKPLIVIPRLRKYGENYNDHQKELAGAMAQAGRVLAVEEPSAETLLDALHRIDSLKTSSGKPLELIEAIRRQLGVWQVERNPSKGDRR